MLEDVINKIQIKNKLSNNNIGTNLLLTHYDKIKSLRPYKDPLNMEKWNDVINKILEGLTLSKDINLIAWLSESLSYRYNIQGFISSLKILEDLIKTFPDCYPQDIKKKEETIGWIKENFAFWLKEEEIFPAIYFRQIHSNIQMCNIDSKFVMTINLNQEELNQYIENKKININEIKNYIKSWKIPLFDSLEKQILSFFTKLENFYNKVKEINNKLERNSTENVNTLSKEQIYIEINNLVDKGLKIDSHDILLYLIHKILILRSKNNNTITMKLIKDNSIDGLFNF